MDRVMVRLMRRLFGAVLVLSVCAGCQQGLGVDAVNRCRVPVEVSATSSDGGSFAWQFLEPGEKREIGSLVEDPDSIKLYIRVPGAEVWERFVVPRTEWNEWRVEGTRYELLVVLVDEYCP